LRRYLTFSPSKWLNLRKPERFRSFSPSGKSEPPFFRADRGESWHGQLRLPTLSGFSRSRRRSSLTLICRVRHIRMLIGCVTPSSEFLVKQLTGVPSLIVAQRNVLKSPARFFEELDLLETKRTSAARRAENVQIAGIDRGCLSRQSLHLRKTATVIPASISLQLSLVSGTGIYFVGDGTNV
jgi:hypothetical protein